MQVLSIGFTAPSIAATFGIPVPTALQTGTMFFVGMLIGAFVFGRLADRIGRRPVLMMAVVIDAICGVASAFAPDFQWLLLLRFLTGIGVGGTLPVDYTMMAEFLPSDRRGRWLVLLESFWAVGTILLAILALIAVSRGDDAWRLIFLVTGIPALVGVVFRFFVPESPLYLNKSGRSARHARCCSVSPPPIACPWKLATWSRSRWSASRSLRSSRPDAGAAPSACLPPGRLSRSPTTASSFICRSSWRARALASCVARSS